MREKKDVFGRDLEVGQIVAWPSSTDFFLGVVVRVVRRRVDNKVMGIRIAYPHYSDEEKVVRRKLNTGLDVMIIDPAWLLLYEGGVVRWRSNYIMRLLALSEELRLKEAD